MKSFLVIDPSITHGVVMKVEKKEGETPSFIIVDTWINKNALGRNIDTLDKLSYSILYSLINRCLWQYEDICIYIDYDIHTAMFSQQRKLVQYMAFFMGSFYARLIGGLGLIGISPDIEFLNPSDIRRWLGISQRASKQVVWSTYSEIYGWNIGYPQPTTDKEWRKLERNHIYSDTLDCEIMGRYILETNNDK